MDKFNFNRFGKVVVRDFHSALSLYGTSMIIIMLMPLAIWMGGISLHPLSAGLETSPETRLSVISFLSVLAGTIAPMKIYKSCNLRGTGNYFAMLPASLGEKFWSMVLYSFVLVPLAVFLGSCVVDTLLTILPFGPYHRPLWSSDGYQFTTSVFDISGYRGFGYFLRCVVSLFSTVSIFLFTNTIFKKNKFIKTILWLMLISFVLFLVAIPIIANNVDTLGYWVRDHLDNWDEERFFRFIYWSSLALEVAVMAVLMFFTYRRLKKMQY